MSLLIYCTVNAIFCSGTTWLQEVAYLVCNNADTAKATEKHLYERFPYIEATMAQTGAEGGRRGGPT